MPQDILHSDPCMSPSVNIGFQAFLICLVLLSGCGAEEDLSDDTEGVSSTQVLEGPDPLTSDLDGFDTAVAKAIQDARLAVQADPKSGETWGRLGKVLLAHDMFDAAAACFAEATRLSSRDPRWHYFEAIARQTVDPVTASERLRRAVELFGPRAAEPQIRLAELLLELEQVGEAETIVTGLLNVKPDETRAHTTLAKIHLLKGEPRACLASLERAFANQRPTRQDLLLAAEAHRRLGELDEAKRRNALAAGAPNVGLADPYYAEVLELRTGLKASLSLADRLYVQNRVEESIQLLQQVVKDYPDSEWAQILLARGLIRMRRLPDAQIALNQAIKLNPSSFEAHFRMAVAYQVSAQHERAAEWFEKTVELQPGSAVAYKNLGLCRFALKDMDAAESALKKSVSVQPNYIDGHMALGEFFARRGQFRAAREALKAAQHLRPNDKRVSAMIRQLDDELNAKQ